MQASFVGEIIGVSLFLVFFYVISRGWPQRQNKERETFIDGIKGLAIVGVVVIHALTFYPQYAFLNTWLWAALAFFVLASGYVLHLQHAAALSLRDYSLKMLRRLVLPYVLLSILFLILQGTSLRAIPAGLLFGRANGNYYFIPILLQLYVVYPLLRRYKAQVLSVVGFVLAYVFSLYFWNFHFQASLVQWNANEWSLIFAGRYFFYFLLGMYFSQFTARTLPWRSTLGWVGAYAIVSVGMSLWLGWTYQTLLYPVAFFLFLALLFPITERLWRPLVVLGPHTLLIYLLHSKVVYNWGGPWIVHVMPSWTGLLLLTLLATLLPFLFSRGVSAVFLWYAARKPLQS